MQSIHETSGELLARSFFLRSPLQTELTALLERFEGFIVPGLETSEVSESFQAHDNHVETALKTTEVLRNEVNARYAGQIERFQSRTEKLLRSSELVLALKDSVCKDHLEAVDKELLGLCTSYSGVIHEEYKEYSRIEGRKIADIDRQVTNAQTRFKLCRFGEFVQAETEGAIQIRSLLPGDSQFARCKRAVLENSRIAKLPNLTGEVVDVFKIENKPLLQRFERECAGVKNCRVKGLFAPLSQDLIERTAVCGLANPAEIPNTLKAAFVLCPPSKSTKGRRAMESPSRIPLLATRFSRYSFSMDDDVDAPCEVHVLALCRVLISRLYTAKAKAQEYSTFSPTLANDYDAVFNPDTEEYTILRDQFVLPEFIIRYQVFRTGGAQRSVTQQPRSFLSHSSLSNSLTAADKSAKLPKSILSADYRLTAFAALQIPKQKWPEASKSSEEPSVQHLESQNQRAARSELTSVEKVATLAKSAILHEIKKRII